MRIAVCAALLISSLGVGASAQQGQPSAVPVGTVSAERKPIAQTLDFVGRVEATLPLLWRPWTLAAPRAAERAGSSAQVS